MLVFASCLSSFCACLNACHGAVAHQPPPLPAIFHPLSAFHISLPSSFFFPHLFSLVFSGMSPLWLSLSLLSHYVQVYGSLCATSRVILISSSSCPSWLISQSLLAQSRLSPVLGLNVSRNRCIIQWRELTSHRGRSRSRSRSGSGSGRRSGRRSRSRGTMLCI